MQLWSKYKRFERHCLADGEPAAYGVADGEPAAAHGVADDEPAAAHGVADDEPAAAQGVADGEQDDVQARRLGAEVAGGPNSPPAQREFRHQDQDRPQQHPGSAGHAEGQGRRPSAVQFADSALFLADAGRTCCEGPVNASVFVRDLSGAQRAILAQGTVTDDDRDDAVGLPWLGLDDLGCVELPVGTKRGQPAASIAAVGVDAAHHDNVAATWQRGADAADVGDLVTA